MGLVFGVLSSLAAIVILAILVAGFNWVTNRRAVKKFLHVKDRGVNLYASRITVKLWGSLGADGVVRSYSGPTIAGTELESIIQIEGFLSSLRPTPVSLGSALSRIRITSPDTSLSFHMAPENESGIDSTSSIVSMGSPAYNIVSAATQRDFPQLACFSSDYRSIGIAGVGTTTDVEAFLVERAINPNLNRCTFYLAGQSALGTQHAAGYLIRHWKELYKRFGEDQNFALVFAGNFAVGGSPELLFETHS